MSFHPAPELIAEIHHSLYRFYGRQSITRNDIDAVLSYRFKPKEITKIVEILWRYGHINRAAQAGEYVLCPCRSILNLE